MKDRSIKKLGLFALLWPIFLEQLLQMIMGNVDTLMLSKYSDGAVAAVGVAIQIYTVATFMFGFITVGTSVLIAQFIGAKEEKRASETAVVAIALNMVFGIFLSILLYIFAEPLLRIFKLPQVLMDFGIEYLTIVGSFAFTSALIMTIGAILRSYGYVKETMYVAFFVNILNVTINFLFLFGPFGIPVLGVTGVAISTSVSRVIGLLAITIILAKCLDQPLPYKKLFHLPVSYMKSILKIGIPSAGEYISYNLSQIVITYFIALIGTVALTTKIYTQNLTMFVFLFTLSIGQATQILIGRFIGANQHEDAYHQCMKSLIIIMIISFTVGVSLCSFSSPLLSIFTTNTEIIKLGQKLIFLSLLLEAGRAVNVIIIGSLNAAGDVKFPVYIGILSMWGLSVPLSYLLGIQFGLGLVGIWFAFIADEWLRGLLMLHRWRSRTWQHIVIMN